MSLGLVSPLLNRGVRSRWLASLPGAGTTKMLTIDSSGDTSFQDIPVAAWGSITGTLSAQTDLQSALDGKLSLTGGTLTGLVTANSTANITTSPKLFSFQHNGVEYGSVIADYNNGNGARARITAATFSTTGNNSVFDTAGFTAAGSGVQLYYNNNGINLIFQGQSFNHHVRFSGSDGTVHFGGSIGFTSFGAASGAADLFVLRDAANTFGQRNSTNAQTFRLYGTYTDASNYRRLYLSSTTAGAFTLGVEGAGTGASGNTLTVESNLQTSSSARFTSTGGATGCEVFGASTTVTGNSNVVIGNSASTTYGPTGSVVIGAGASSENSQSVNIGANSRGGVNGVAVGQNATVFNGAYSVAIGKDSSSRQTATIAIGYGATSVKNNQFISGSSSTNITEVLFGNGATNASPIGFTLTTTSGLGTNIAGATLGIAAGQGTGTGVGGAVKIYTAPAGSSGSSLNALAERFGIEANGLITLGGTTASFPAIKRNGTALNFRLADDSADAPITAGAGTFSGNIQTTGYVQVGSDSARVRLTQNGISNLSSGLQYNLISWTGGIIIDAIKISGYAYRGINIERVAGQGGQTWLTVNLEGSSTAFGDTPRQALDVRGNAIIDGNVVLHKSATSTSLQVHNTFTDASNYIRQSLSFTTYSSTVHAQHVVEGAGTGAVNVPFVITPRGTGAFILGPMPNGTATGGNARGQYAVDLQVSRGAASQVASGTSSFQVGEYNTAAGYTAACIGGSSNTASGDMSVILGGLYNLTTVPTSSLLSGMRGSTYLQGQSVIAFGGRPFGAQNITGGECQSYILTLSGYTTGTTQTRMRGGDTGATWDNYQRITIRSGYTLSALVCIKGIKSDGTAIARFWRFVDITRIGNATTLDVAAETIGTDRNPSACTITIQADDTNEALEILVGGVANETWRWTGTIYGTEIKYGT